VAFGDKSVGVGETCRHLERSAPNEASATQLDRVEMLNVSQLAPSRAGMRELPARLAVKRRPGMREIRRMPAGGVSGSTTATLPRCRGCCAHEQRTLGSSKNTNQESHKNVLKATTLFPTQAQPARPNVSS